MQKTIKKKQNKLIWGIMISITLHVILISFLYVFFIKYDKSSLISTNKKDTMSTDFISHEKSLDQTTFLSTSEEKLNKIKILEKIPQKTIVHIENLPTSEKKKMSRVIEKKTTFTDTYDVNQNIYSYDLNNLLSKLINCKNTSIPNDNINMQSQKKFTFDEKKHETILYKTNVYKNILIKEINHKFYNNINNYSGKTCILRVRLPSNGTPVTIKSSDGDDLLCQAAISAIKLAKFPPPNLEIYETFKNITLNFSP